MQVKVPQKRTILEIAFFLFLLALGGIYLYFHGKHVQRDQTEQKQTIEQKEKVVNEGTQEIQKAEEMGRSGDAAGARKYLLELCRSARQEARAGD